MKKRKKLTVTVQRGEDRNLPSTFVRFAPGRLTCNQLVKDGNFHFYYAYLVKAGLPALEPGEIVTVKVHITRAKAGRPKHKQQAVAVGA